MHHLTHAVLTAQQMARADALTIARGTPGIDLMEAAGKAVAETVLAVSDGDRVLVIAGTGNNGGDGFIAARILETAGKSVTVAVSGNFDRIHGDALTARDRWKGPTVAAATPLPEADVIVDAMFGSGLDRDVTGVASDLIAAMNASSARIVSVDVPSGLDANTGQVRGVAVKADATATFFRRKPGHLLMPGRELCGKVQLAQIGISEAVLRDINWTISENCPALWLHDFPTPGTAGHKYSRGHAAVLSGPAYQTGAARLTAHAALRSGAGLVTLVSPANAMVENAAHLTAVMLRQAESSEEISSVLSDPRYSSVALGPGLGLGPGPRNTVETVLKTRLSAALDADALTSFRDCPNELFSMIKTRTASVLMTPHEGEFQRLFPELKDQALGKTSRALSAAEISGAVVILKGADTIVAAPDGRVAINANAPPWLATAGSGDVLTGIVTGLIAQAMPAFEAGCAGVWLHGAAGSEAGPGLIAEDLDQAMRPAISNLYHAVGSASRGRGS